MSAAELAALLDLGESLIWAGFLVFLRVGGVMALLPAFGEQGVPARIRLVLALAFTAVVAPAMTPVIAGTVPLPVDGAGLLRPVLAEVSAGVALGLGFRLFVIALQTAGAMAAQATSLAQLLGAAGPEPQPAIAQLLVVAGLALAVAAGLHLQVAEALIRSYDVLPAGRLPAAAEIAGWGLDRIALAFALAFSLAAPFVVAATLYNAALGAINRAMPQLMVIFVGAPALTAGALLLLALATPAALALWTTALGRFASDPFAGP